MLSNAPTEHRPWGNFTVLADTSLYKVKELVVLPNSRLSLQSHEHRSEMWVVVDGEILAHCDGEDTLLSAGQALGIPKGKRHRITNAANKAAIIVETQWGTILSEQDIIRYSDDYGRAEQ
jgi:mannose-6-phosphate isomerase-like protein (cupin superfamily)